MSRLRFPHLLTKQRKKNLCRGLEPPKKSCRGRGHEKKFLLAGKVPPPTHHFSNGPSLHTYTMSSLTGSDWLKNLTPAFQPMRSKATIELCTCDFSSL